MITSTDTIKAYNLFIATFKKRAKDKLKASGRGIWTGKMLESITGNVEYADGEYNITLDLEQYGHFIDEGVNGVEKNNGSRFSYTDKMPPISAIKPWATSKGINPYAVQRSIYKKGIKGVHFLESTIDEEYGKLVDYLAEAESLAILNELED